MLDQEKQLLYDKCKYSPYLLARYCMDIIRRGNTSQSLLGVKGLIVTLIFNNNIFDF